MRLRRMIQNLYEARHHWDTPEFRRWFGHSIVRDRNGNPAVVYHGTISWAREGRSLGNFDTFDRTATARIFKRQPDFNHVGIWFSDRPDEHGAGMYAGATPDETLSTMIYPCYLHMTNPWRPRSFDEFIGAARKAAGLTEKPQRNPKTGSTPPAGLFDPEPFRQWLKQQGHDGIMFGPEIGVDMVRDGQPQRVWVVLEPTQIKSASGNRGTYDPANPKLTEKREEIPIRGMRVPDVVTYIDPSPAEFMAALNASQEKELRGIMIRKANMGERVVIVWDAFDADHIAMITAFRDQGWVSLASDTPHLEFTTNPGFGTRNVAHTGMVQYGPVWGTRSAKFRTTWLAQRLIRMGSSALVEAEVDQTEINAFETNLKTQLGLSDLSLYLRNDGDLHVVMIGVPRGSRGEGIGTRAMEAICAYADQHGHRIVLSPAQKDPEWGTTSRGRLIRFYQRFGFKRNRGRYKDFRISDSMYRNPRSTIPAR